MPVQFFSTNNRSNVQPLKEAVLRSLPVDRGLYLPIEIGRLPDEFWQDRKSVV